jgi:hypothetical protein
MTIAIEKNPLKMEIASNVPYSAFEKRRVNIGTVNTDKNLVNVDRLP